jgi:hypothetical protein
MLGESLSQAATNGNLDAWDGVKVTPKVRLNRRNDKLRQLRPALRRRNACSIRPLARGAPLHRGTYYLARERWPPVGGVTAYMTIPRRYHLGLGECERLGRSGPL